MTALSWNCRGLGNLRTIQELMDIMSTKMPKLVFLMEVKVGRSHIDKLKTKLKFEGSFIVDSVQGSGGLVLLWKKKIG